MTELEILIDTHARCSDDACRSIMGRWIMEEYEKKSQTAASTAGVSEKTLSFARVISTHIGAFSMHDPKVGK